MEKILGYHIREKEKLERILAPMKIRFEEIQEADLRQRVGDLAEGKKAPLVVPFTGMAPEESLLIFCGVSEKHLDKILFTLRSMQMKIDLKSVLTPTNAGWTVLMLFLELSKEKKQMPAFKDRL